MKLIGFAILLMLCAASVLVYRWLYKPQRWAVVYSTHLPAEDFTAYDLLVFDRDGHPPLAPLNDGKRKLLGYISFGEAEVNRKNYPEMQALDVFITGVEGWHGGDFIDVRKPQWRSYLLETIIPAVLAQGFNGIMLDTTDNLIWLENKDPATYAGLSRAAAALIKDIRAAYPSLHIMLNRGLEILPQVAGDIDALLAESIYTSWNTATNTPAMATPDIQQLYLNKLRPALAAHPALKVYSLDYWPPDDISAIRDIYKEQRRRGYYPYVSTPDLQSLYPEPAKKPQ